LEHLRCWVFKDVFNEVKHNKRAGHSSPSVSPGHFEALNHVEAMAIISWRIPLKGEGHLNLFYVDYVARIFFGA